MTGVLNTQQGYLFVHVPKCAGTSIASVLLSSEGSVAFADIPGLPEVMERENKQSAEVVLNVVHARARDIRSLLGVGEYNRLSSFAVVRNPWDRLRSLFRYSQTTQLKGSPPSSFPEFVQWTCVSRRGSMWDRVADREGEIIVKHVYRYEFLAGAFRELARNRLRCRAELPYLNSSERTRDERFTSRLIAEVQSAFRRDFDLFGYPTEPEQ